ncbi:hypothetical protein FA10DRAFT_90740 [Acaromyces ingoldii]|uniref:Uncharacterized protein n=1 Tax=Acaromyces ingoldii TaxID=215250 RepID=A0A316YSZ2_9BASI|nr:hypothetical protein FA10DRAFT_90740 [Acaromyces ingoldii]PWN92351.1 hypothetical protein FA10DRAFT_90740 [Acaromyces ingoldii]
MLAFLTSGHSSDHYSLLEEFEELRRRTASTTSRNTTSCDGPLTGRHSEGEHRQGTQDISVSGDFGGPSSKKAIRPPRRGAVRQRRADNSTGAISTQSLVNDKKSSSPSGDEQVAERLDGRVEEAMLEMKDKGKQTEEGTAWLDFNSAATDASPLTEKDYQVSPTRGAEDQVHNEELLSPLSRSLANELGLSPTPSEIRRKRCLSAELGLLVEKDEEKHHEALESGDTVSPLKQDKWKRRSLGSEMGLRQFSYDDLDAPNGSPVSSQVGRRRTSIEWGSASKRSKKAESSSCGGSVLSVGTETEIIISPDVTIERKGSVKSVCASVTEDQAEQQAVEKKVEAQEELQQHVVVLEGSYSDESCRDEEGPAPIQHPEMETSSAEHEEDIGNVTSQCSIEEVLFVRQAGAALSDEAGEEIPRRTTYQPGMPLELLEEVTEEPTVSEVSDESVTGLQAANTKRSEGLPGSDKEQIVTMSTPPRAQGISQMLDRSWERLHGLGTPSSVGGTSAYGWAELHLNSSSPRSASRSPSKSTTPRTRPSMSKKIHQQRLHQQLASHAVLSPFSSPQKVIGLNSSFWINSPQPVKLELQKLLYSQANAPLDPFSSSSKVISPRTRPRLLADQMEMIQNDDDDWVELEADEEKVTANGGRSASTTRRWKRMSSSSTMSLASIATSTTSGSLRRSSNGSSVLENLQQASRSKGKGKERRSLHEIWSGKKHGKTGTADTPATPTYPTSKTRDATTLGLDALNGENGKTDLGESDGDEKTPVTASQTLHHRPPSPPASSMATSMRATGGCEEEEGDHGSSYSTDAVSIKSCKRTSECEDRSGMCVLVLRRSTARFC